MLLKSIAIVGAVLTSLSASAINHGFMYNQRSALVKSMSSDEIGFYNQKLNHKSPSSPTFKQRYFVDSQYAAGNDSPVFYIICGEWNCAGTKSYSYVVNLAKKMKAHLIALEHRFYGESLPTTNLTTQALRPLNLQAAIDDLATFQRFISEKKNLTGKWIAVGGSYAGTLAAFYREKHPELVSGALASSAPVLMKNEFTEYDAHIASVVNKTTCGDKVREAVALIEGRVKSEEGFLEMLSLFQAKELKDRGDFLYVVADMLAAAVQYGRDDMFCTILQRDNDLVRGYALAGINVLSAMGTTPYEISLAVGEKVEVTSHDNMRQWLWQSCREFGWFQVANGTGEGSSRSSQIDLDYHERMCKRLFNVSMGRDGALNAKWYYPLFDPQVSKIIFTNGSNDPWLTLSITNGAPNFNLFMIDGAAHCDDLRINYSNPELMAAQYSIEKVVRNWLR
jgi:pimeloyl-ACP methyl ester carboxylesterase